MDEILQIDATFTNIPKLKDVDISKLSDGFIEIIMEAVEEMTSTTVEAE